ncbi:MAG TPA: hypothetical protein VLW49_09785 [Gaiellaceae bacterium]|nr:hypothetical protein [Gaiellaceae bacterium]
MRVVRLVIPLAAVLAGVLATSSPAAVKAPTGLHGFLLSANEKVTHTFHRTPSFAWRPVTGADHYELQLSTSATFRENGIMYDDASLTTPVAAPPVTLPWISGSPYALYARVRAVFSQARASAWSKPFGFDVLPPAAPKPMTAAPGLLRWTPVDGADGYEVWLLGPDKIEPVHTNVLDEREYYAFHPTQQWIGDVRWRVRAIRDDLTGRVNGVPAALYGPWSKVYTSTNPTPSNGPIKLGSTISDIVSNGSLTSKAHELTPAFTWSGDESLSGVAGEFFRVYVFTDKECLNRVYSSPLIESPAYAPRLGGPLAMPQDPGDAAGAAEAYLGDGTEANDLTYDLESITPTEQLPAATPTTTLPGGSSGLTISGNPGPPVDLWDTNWPESGYYWTVIPVAAVGDGSATVVAPGALANATVVPMSSTFGLEVGDVVAIGSGPNQDSGKIIAVGPTSITLDTPLSHNHGPGDPVTTTPIRYVDLELAQDACAAGRVQRFGVASAPSLTTGSAPYATGLSSKGRLITSVRSARFYGEPLVAWTPAASARVYEVQWSRRRYPFNPQADPSTGAQGILTMATSAVLPLKPGTWWYRVRGFDYNLPTNSQQMAWSTPQKLVVARPRFRVAAVKTARKQK